MFVNKPFTTAEKRKKARLMMRLIIALAGMASVLLIVGLVINFFLTEPCDIYTWELGKEVRRNNFNQRGENKARLWSLSNF